MQIVLALAVAAVLAAGFIDFTTPGQRVLNALGLSTADGDKRTFSAVVALTAQLLWLAIYFFIGISGSAFGEEGHLACEPSVSVETESCPGGGGQIISFARVTNGCVCDVNVTVHLANAAGAAVLTKVPKNGGTGRQMIAACGYKEMQFTSYSYEFDCPKTDQSPSNSQSSSENKKAGSTGMSSLLNRTQQHAADLGNRAQSQHTEDLEKVKNGEARDRANIKSTREAAGRKCIEDENSCQSSCSTTNANLRGSNAYQIGAVSQATVGAYYENCRLYCTSNGQICRSSVLNVQPDAGTGDKNLQAIRNL